MCNQERRKVKRKGDHYSTHTSLIVAAPKKLLSVAMNGCCHGDQGLVTHAKKRFSQVRLFILISACKINPFVIYFLFFSWHLKHSSVSRGTQRMRSEHSFEATCNRWTSRKPVKVLIMSCEKCYLSLLTSLGLIFLFFFLPGSVWKLSRSPQCWEDLRHRLCSFPPGSG